jgi:hypothetical protein
MAESTATLGTSTPVIPQDVVLTEAAPNILIDGISGVSVINGVVKINCYAVHQVAAQENKPFLALRLAMSLTTLVGIHGAISQLISEFEKSGLIQRPSD